MPERGNMKENKYLPVRIIHVVLMLVSLALCVIALARNSADTTVYGRNPLTVVGNVLNILAVLCGIIYIVNCYRKDAAKYYKVFIIILFVAELLQMVYIFILPISASAIDIICNAVPVICLAVLADCSYGYCSRFNDYHGFEHIRIRIEAKRVKK